MRPSPRLLASFAAGALVAVPGFALAQGAPFDTPPVETPPVEVPATPDVTESETEEVEEPEPVGTETEDEAPEPVETGSETEDAEALEVEEADDEGHGETISTLAGCLPSGNALHGTGLTKGHVMSQAASSGEVVLEEGGDVWTVATPEDAEAVCAVVQAMADEAESPETAKGRPDWAGPKDGDDETEELEGDESEDEAGESRGGPPPHANGRAKGRG